MLRNAQATRMDEAIYWVLNEVLSLNAQELACLFHVSPLSRSSMKS